MTFRGKIPTLHYINGRPTTVEPVMFYVGDIDSDSLWALFFDWEVTVGARTFVVPRGSTTNFGSIPWFVRWAISPTDALIAIPSIVHDYLVGEWVVDVVDSDGTKIPTESTEKLSWEEAATVFLTFSQDLPKRKQRLKGRIVYFCIYVYGHLFNK
jgi:hypothetical protein